jgi:hypothetical protein
MIYGVVTQIGKLSLKETDEERARSKISLMIAKQSILIP